MSSLFNKKSGFEKPYGWDVELTCSQCKFSGKPRYEGWSPNLETHIGEDVTTYAKVACPRCGRRLTDEAGRKLVELFKDLDITPKNKSVLGRFIAGLLLVPAALAFLLFVGTQMEWWGWGLGSVWILLVSAISIPILVFKKNKGIASLTSECGCGSPHFVHMGLLDGDYCYRCFSCGGLLRVRE